MARRMLDHAGYARRARDHGRPRRGRRRRRLRARPDPRRRTGRAPPRRDDPAALRLRRAGDHRRRRLREGDAHRARDARDRRPRRERAAPGAWIVDFTNPVGIVTRALLDHGHRACGLCNVAIGIQRWIARGLGVEPERVAIGQVGLNHLTWVRSVEVDGEDILERLLAERLDDIADEIGLPARLIRDLGAIPSYYLRYFYLPRPGASRSCAAAIARASRSPTIEAGLLELYRDPARGREAGAARAARRRVLQRGRHAAGGRARDRRRRRCRSSTCATPARFRALPTTTSSSCRRGSAATGRSRCRRRRSTPDLLGLVQHVAAYERLAAAAAVADTPVARRRALLAHPLIGQDAMACELAESLFIADQARA